MVFLYRFVTLFNLKLKNTNIEKKEIDFYTYDGFVVTGINILGVQDYRTCKCHLRYSCSCIMTFSSTLCKNNNNNNNKTNKTKQFRQKCHLRHSCILPMTTCVGIVDFCTTMCGFQQCTTDTKGHNQN